MWRKAKESSEGIVLETYALATLLFGCVAMSPYRAKSVMTSSTKMSWGSVGSSSNI